jgi:hypothetical protein
MLPLSASVTARSSSVFTVVVIDMDINTSDTSTPTQSDFWSDYSGSCAPTKQSGILVPSFLFILYRQWKHVFYFVA